MDLFGKKRKAAEMAERAEKAALKEDIRDYVIFCETATAKNDWEVDWLEFAYESYARFYAIAEKHPQVQEIGDWKVLTINTPDNRRYSWLDDDGTWYNWKYPDMKKHQETFERGNTWEAYRRAFEKIADRYSPKKLMLEYIGCLGGGPDWPYASCAYLSFAYFEKMSNNELIGKLKSWLSEN